MTRLHFTAFSPAALGYRETWRQQQQQQQPSCLLGWGVETGEGVKMIIFTSSADRYTTGGCLKQGGAYENASVFCSRLRRARGGGRKTSVRGGRWRGRAGEYWITTCWHELPLGERDVRAREYYCYYYYYYRTTYVRTDVHGSGDTRAGNRLPLRSTPNRPPTGLVFLPPAHRSPLGRTKTPGRPHNRRMSGGADVVGLAPARARPSFGGDGGGENRIPISRHHTYRAGRSTTTTTAVERRTARAFCVRVLKVRNFPITPLSPRYSAFPPSGSSFANAADLASWTKLYRVADRPGMSTDLLVTPDKTSKR